VAPALYVRGEAYVEDATAPLRDLVQSWGPAVRHARPEIVTPRSRPRVGTRSARDELEWNSPRASSSRASVDQVRLVSSAPSRDERDQWPARVGRESW